MRVAGGFVFVIALRWAPQPLAVEGAAAGGRLLGLDATAGAADDGVGTEAAGWGDAVVD